MLRDSLVLACSDLMLRLAHSMYRWGGMQWKILITKQRREGSLFIYLDEDRPSNSNDALILFEIIDKNLEEVFITCTLIESLFLNVRAVCVVDICPLLVLSCARLLFITIHTKKTIDVKSMRVQYQPCTKCVFCVIHIDWK